MHKSDSQYFSQSPAAESKPVSISYALKLNGSCENINFIGDNGVFSKRRVDYGTDLLIRSLPPLSGRILDLGCGYGVAGISAALLNPNAEVWFSDVNARAIGLCRENYRRIVQLVNPGARDARIIQSDGFENFPDAEFDAIITNPPVRAGKAVLFGLYGGAFGRLKAAGAFFAVIQRKQGMESTRAELARLFGNCEDFARKSGFHVLRAVRRD